MDVEQKPPIPHERVPRSYEELSAMSDEEVIGQLRYQGKHLGAISFNFWLAELERRRAAQDRREQAKVNDTIRRLTWAVAIMTLLVLTATIAQVVMLTAS